MDILKTSLLFFQDQRKVSPNDSSKGNNNEVLITAPTANTPVAFAEMF